MIIIGSRAAKLLHPDFRNPKDYDFIGTREEFQKLINTLPQIILVDEKEHKSKIKFVENNRTMNLEFEFFKSASNQILSQISTKTSPFFDIDVFCPSTQCLYLLKKSHLFWNIHWEKSIEDMHWLRERATSPNIMEKAFYSAKLREYQIRFDDVFSYDTSNFNFDVFKNKILLMTREKYGDDSKENIIKNLRYTATNKSFGNARQYIIENYPKILTL